MNYLAFKNALSPFTLFSLNDIRRADAAFHRARLNEWQEKGYIRKIVRGYYMFTDSDPDEAVLFEIANRIYSPSYISFETALAHYGLIPESVYLILSASTLKTSRFRTGIGEFSYRTIKPSLFWGYAIGHIGQRHYKIASPEKAILDFFYLHATWNNDDDFNELRLDRARFAEIIDRAQLNTYIERFANRELARRMQTLMTYLEREREG